eukprot:1158290-Pelagomonas_calceolata.AAC.8
MVPWVGVAARLPGGAAEAAAGSKVLSQPQDQPQQPPSAQSDQCQGINTGIDDSGRGGGRAYCFLPLPVLTGLPVHVNGFFELSSNRRDIWYGPDLEGASARRAAWNVALLQVRVLGCGSILAQSV